MLLATLSLAHASSTSVNICQLGSTPFLPVFAFKIQVSVNSNLPPTATPTVIQQRGSSHYNPTGQNADHELSMHVSVCGSTCPKRHDTYICTTSYRQRRSTAKLLTVCLTERQMTSFATRNVFERVQKKCNSCHHRPKDCLESRETLQHCLKYTSALFCNLTSLPSTISF